MKMKIKAFIPLLISTFMLTACGNSEKGDSSSTAENYITNDAYYESYSTESENYDEEILEENGADSSIPEKDNNTSTDVIRKEMLVYSCNMVIDVLDFDTAINSFKNSHETYGAFVEAENYNDGGSDSRWQYYDSDNNKWKTYTATVRVPSSNYDAFCETAAQLGDLRSKNASVENMSREYYDLSATLEIYEAKEERYMELLSTISDEQYAIKVEEQLTDIQIEISKIKTRMNDIQTDVAYSYVYITINEVKEYTAEPEKTDTFLQRLGNTVSNATSSFLSVMENLLFILIYILPHLLVISLIIFIIIKIVKTSHKRKAAKRAASAGVLQEVQAPEKNDK